MIHLRTMVQHRKNHKMRHDIFFFFPHCAKSEKEKEKKKGEKRGIPPASSKRSSHSYPTRLVSQAQHH